MPAWTGKTINNVQIGELIARGGMAEVYHGEHKSLKRNVAVKIMRDHLDGDPESRSRFAREAQVIANLRHPNIIQIYDYTLTDDQPCLIMELVPGVSLGAYLKSLHSRGEKLPTGMVARILSMLASAIDYAHEQNIVHRDIKPANVLLRTHEPFALTDPLPDEVEPVLTDFGLVRLLDSTVQTSTGTVSGTPAYMSPEQARGDRVDKHTDVYSLGVMAYEMLAGTVPFDAESSFGVLMKHLNEPPPPIPGISTDLQAVINRALSKEASLRYDTAGEFAREFIAVFNGETISTKTLNLPKESAPQADAPTAKIPAWIPAVIGALVIFALGFTALRWFTSPPPDPNQPIGRITYMDFNYVMDKAVLTTFGLEPPKAGMQYEVWYLAEGGETRRRAGVIAFNESGQGEGIVLEPGRENLLELYDQVEVTLEPVNDPNPEEPSGQVVASSVFPPLSLVHIRHVLVSFHGAPDSEALIQGLWYTADDVDTSMRDMEKAFKDGGDGNEALVRKRNEEVINLLAGRASTDLHRDWDGDGKIDDPGDGFGLLGNDSGLGYIPATISHAFFAADAVDATGNIKTNSAHVIACAENMRVWSEQLLKLALQLQDMPFGAGMEPIIKEMRLHAENTLFGVDSNDNRLIEPIMGECGADSAYEYAYIMAEMPLLTGRHRIPPPAQTP
jgi:serine/threonine protein kinase